MNLIKQYEQELSNIVNDGILACEDSIDFTNYASYDGEGVFDDTLEDGAMRLQELYDEEVYPHTEIKAILNACKRRFEQRIYDAFESAMSQAEVAFREELREIEGELIDLVIEEIDRYKA